MSVFFIILAEFLFVSILIMLLFKLRNKIGLAPLYILLGSIQYLQTRIAASIQINVFDSYSIYPGSVILFSSVLFAVLLIYIKEGVASTRSLIYGIVMANIALALIIGITNYQQLLVAHGSLLLPNEANLFQLNYQLFAKGTIILVLDFLLLVIVYKAIVTKFKKGKLFWFIFLSLLIVFCFDAVAFTTAGFYSLPVYKNILISHLIGKSFSALLFAVVLYVYIRFIDKGDNKSLFIADQSKNLFSIFSYLKEYEVVKAEKEKADQAMIESEEKFAAAFNENVVGLAIINAESRYVEINKAFEKLMGIKRADIINKTSQESKMLEEMDAASRERIENKIKMDGRLVEEELDIVLKSGRRLHVLYSLEPVSIAGNTNWLLSLYDISEIKRAEAALKKSEEYLENIINNIGDPVFVKDEQSKLLLANDAFCEIFGLLRADIIGKTLAEEVPQDQIESFMRIDNEVLSTGIENVNEELLTVRDGEPQIISTKKSRFIDDSGNKFLIGVIRDITKRKHAEERVLETSKELRLLMQHLQNVREDERKRIGREIHDDLGQQLTAIKMYSAWIDKRIAPEQSEIKGKLKSIIELLDSSNQSIRKILNELRIGVLDNDGLVDGLRWLCQQFEDSTLVAVDFTTNLQKIKVDEETAICVFRILQESLNNITKHAEAKKVTVSVGAAAGKLTMVVTDDGKGFETENVPVVNSFGILGMKERVAALGGDFVLVSSIGAGTKLTVAVSV